MVTGSESGYDDLIFMDMQMPVMDGCTAARKIRASGKTSGYGAAAAGTGKMAGDGTGRVRGSMSPFPVFRDRHMIIRLKCLKKAARRGIAGQIGDFFRSVNAFVQTGDGRGHARTRTQLQKGFSIIGFQETLHLPGA